MDILTDLDTVKTLLCISLNDSSSDALLNIYIKKTSEFISRYCGRKFGRATLTENIKGNALQFLPLERYPIREIEELTENGNELVIDQDYFMSNQDAEAGMLFKPNGWAPSVTTRGLVLDPGPGVRNIDVTYTGGYYLPDDSEYIEGDDDSLPSDISYVCAAMVVDAYNKKMNGGNGLKSLTEGGLSYSWFNGNEAKNNSAGIIDEYAGVLNNYKRVVFA